MCTPNFNKYFCLKANYVNKPVVLIFCLLSLVLVWQIIFYVIVNILTWLVVDLEGGSASPPPLVSRFFYLKKQKQNLLEETPAASALCYPPTQEMLHRMAPLWEILDPPLVTSGVQIHLINKTCALKLEGSVLSAIICPACTIRIVLATVICHNSGTCTCIRKQMPKFLLSNT